MLISRVAYQDGTKVSDTLATAISVNGYAASLLVMGEIDVLLYFRFKKAKWL